MNPKVIVIDGKTYNSVNEMPPDIRQKYEQAMRSLKDSDGNRVPDVFETANPLADQNGDGIPDIFSNLASTNTVASSMKLIIDGKEYNRIEDLPPEVRARYEETMGAMDANRNGIPDFVEGMFPSLDRNASVSSSPIAEAPRRSASFEMAPGNPQPVSPTITPDTSNGFMLMLAGLFIFLLCVVGAGAVWYFFLR